MAARAHLAGSVLDLAGDVDTAAGELFGTLEASNPEYHFVLGTCGLLQVRGGYQRSAARQLAEQFSIGGLSSGDRVSDQAVTISNWHGGEGYFIHEIATPDRYLEGAGIDGYTLEGSLSLGPYLSAIAAVTSLAVNAINCAIVFKGLLILGLSNGKVYQWDGATLTLCYDTTKTSGIASFMIWEQNLYVGTNDTDGVVYRWVYVNATTTWATNYTVGDLAGDSVTAVPGHAAHIQEGLSRGYYGASASVHALVGEIANTGGTTVAANALALLEPKLGLLIPYDGKLIAIGNDTTNNTWRLYEGDDTATIGWQVKTPIDGGYITCGAVFGDKLYLGDSTKGRIWSYDGNNVELVRQLGSDASPYTASILGMTAWRGGLWASILHTDGTAALLRFDGNRSWSRPVYGLAGSTPGPLVVYNDQLYYAVNSTGAARLYKTDNTFGSGGYVVTGVIDARLLGTDKRWSEVTIGHSALVSGQSVAVAYSLENSGSWTTIGTSSTVGATDATFSFDNDVVGNLIQFRLTLAGSAGSSSVLRVYALVASYRPRPGAKRKWQITVDLTGVRTEGDGARLRTLADGTEETRTGEEMSDQIWEMVDDGLPVLFLDRDRGPQRTVEIVDFDESDADLPKLGDSGLRAGWDTHGTITLQEV